MQGSGISPDKLNLFELLLKKRGISAPGADTIPRRSESDSYPLSFAQQRLWFLDQLEPHSSFYNLTAAVRLTGELDIPALQHSFTEIISRHESLRTTFATREAQPVQLISPPQPLPLPLVDLSTLPPGEAQDEEVRRLARAEATLPFALSTGPLLRARLLRLSPQTHVLLLSMHHIVSDGWSMGVLVRELCTLYAAFASGETQSPLAPLPIQYADYALWQREHLQGEVLNAQLAHWRTHLQGAPALLELPTDRPRPAVQSYRGARHSLRLDAGLTARLRERSREQGAPLFMALFAPSAALLWKYTGEADVVVGTPVANRSRREVEALIGFFVNTLALRVEVKGDERFAELVARVREVCLGGYAHQEVPFERGGGGVGGGRGGGRAPAVAGAWAGGGWGVGGRGRPSGVCPLSGWSKGWAWSGA